MYKEAKTGIILFICLLSVHNLILMKKTQLKNRANLHLYFLLFCFSSLIIGCSDQIDFDQSTWLQEEDAFSNPESILYQWNSFHGEEVSGILMLNSMGSVLEEDPQYDLKATFYNEARNSGQYGGAQLNDIPFKYFERGNFYVPDFGLEAGDEYRERFVSEIDLVWGKANSFSFYSTEKELLVEEELYVPQQFQAIQIISEANDLSSVKAGTQIIWNKDKNNEDIMIEAFYHPDHPQNKGVSEVAKEPMRLFKVIPDNGNYTISDSDLKAFVSGGWVQFTLRRGNFSKLQHKEKNLFYSIGTWSQRNIELKVVR